MRRIPEADLTDVLTSDGLIWRDPVAEAEDGRETCCAVACDGDCSCYEQGREDAAFDFEETSDNEVSERLWEETEKTFMESLRPLEDRLILKDDKTVLGQVNLLRDLLGRLRPLFE